LVNSRIFADNGSQLKFGQKVPRRVLQREDLIFYQVDRNLGLIEFPGGARQIYFFTKSKSMDSSKSAATL